MGDVADFIFRASPRPVKEIALVAAIGLLAGIAGRSYNVSGAGLNLYLLLIAMTGRGKEAIANGISKLMRATKVVCQGAADFEGPSEIASPQALIKWLARSPCVYSIVGEFGLKLKEMSAEKAPPHITGLKRALLDLYHKSSQGATFGAMAYSKREDNTALINSPSWTIVAEGTPETVLENATPALVSSGVLSRFSVISYEGVRVPYNENHSDAVPPPELVQKVAELCAYALGLASTSKVCDVQITIAAKAVFDAFNKYADAKINSNDGTVADELWNRAHLKAMKWAALRAVGSNYINPSITVEQAQWACDEINAQTVALIAKFASGDVGVIAGNEAKQLKAVEKIIGLYATLPFEKVASYGVTAEMHRDRICPAAYVQRRLIDTAAFRGPGGGTRALNDALRRMLDADELRQVPKEQMVRLYGTGARAFAISNGKFIIEAIAA